MAVSDQVSYETRVRPRQAAIAGTAGALLLAAAAVQASGPQPKVSELTIELITYSRREALVVVGAVLNGIGLLGLAATLVFLFSVARYRQPASQGTQISAILGGVLACIGGIVYGVVIVSKAHQFVTAQPTLAHPDPQTYVQANALVSGGALAGLQYAGLLGSLLLAVAFVLVSLRAMRVGLLTRFVGYLGIVAAAASILLVESLPAQVIQIFWLASVAYLLAGRWPGGDPASWRTGEAEPWPTGAQLREQRERAAGRGNGRAKPPPAARRASQPSEVAPTAPGSTRANTPKRKRKRRK
jgi:hypothetical protein